MSKEDSCLSSRLRKLEIDNNPNRVKAAAGSGTGSAAEGKGKPADVNPFMRRRSRSLSSINFGHSCDCGKRAGTGGPAHVRHTTSFKRLNKKILREPVLRLIRCAATSADVGGGKCSASSISASISKQCRKDSRQLRQWWNDDRQDFRSLIDACEQLNLESESNAMKYATPSFLSARSRSSTSLQRQESASVCLSNSSCSRQAQAQARFTANPPCDVTIDELASYFETFVHIPKKMSSMAEMMYI